MALIQATLSTELQALPDVDNEPDAILNMSSAFDGYFGGAASNGAPLNPAIAALGLAAMQGALVGMSADDAGAGAISAGVTAYWAALNVPGAFGASIVPITPPPTIATLAAALTAVFAANITGKLEKEPACDAIAAVWHPIMIAGGLATFMVGPTPTPFPIL